MTTLALWQNFYVIVGSSAGALIGLQFVVLSLIAGQQNTKVDPQTGGAFSTPTIIHFSTVLTLAAIFTAPWVTIRTPTVIYCVVGVAGIAYTILVTRRMRRQKIYQPEFEDWLFHSVLPIVAYGILVGSAIVGQWPDGGHDREALFGVASAVLLLLLTGIHNAWDAVTYHVFIKPKP